MKLLNIYYLNLLLSANAQGGEPCIDEETGDKYHLQCNNNTIEIDQYLTFTWSTDRIMTEDMLNLVPTPDNAKDDRPMSVFQGHFELSGWPDDIEVTPESSFRFCMQYWKKFDDNG